MRRFALTAAASIALATGPSLAQTVPTTPAPTQQQNDANVQNLHNALTALQQNLAGQGAAAASGAAPPLTPDQAAALARLISMPLPQGQQPQGAPAQPGASGVTIYPPFAEGAPAAPAQPPAPPAQRGGPEPYEGPTAKIPIGYSAVATLTTTINSDYPGPWRATLAQPIYSIDRRSVLFPEGSVVVGRVIQIGGTNAAIYNRVGLLPRYIVRPDGYAFKINDQAILDELGINGIADQVDYHIGVQLAAIGAFTAVEALPGVVSSNLGSNNQQAQQNNVETAFPTQAAASGQVILQRYMSLQPTITVRAGAELHIFFQEEMFGPVTGPRDHFELTNIGPKSDPAAPAPRTTP
jgi:type IV secretory pathway VirB10-like protein